MNNALGQEGIPILMMRDERYAVAVADAYSRASCGKKIGVCTVMGGANAAGLQMAYGEMPVLASLKAKSVFPDNHPLALPIRGEPAVDALEQCDVLLAIGTSLSGGNFRHAVPDAQSKILIHCTLDMADINRLYPTRHAVIGDAKFTLKALITELAAQTGGGIKPNPERLAEIKADREALMAKYRPAMESNEKPINPYRVYNDLMKVLDPDDSCVTHDSGNTRDQLSTIYQARIPRGFMGWGNVTTLGFGLAAAIGAKLAHPSRQCINFTGDAGVGYMLGNLEALVRYGIGVTTVHINNGGFSGYGPGFWGPGHSPYTCEVCDHVVADMSEAVRGLGYYAEHVAESSEIIPALRRALDENAEGRPAYLEFICSQYPVYGSWAKASA